MHVNVRVHAHAQTYRHLTSCCYTHFPLAPAGIDTQTLRETLTGNWRQIDTNKRGKKQSPQRTQAQPQRPQCMSPTGNSRPQATNTDKAAGLVGGERAVFGAGLAELLFGIGLPPDCAGAGFEGAGFFGDSSGDAA